MAIVVSNIITYPIKSLGGYSLSSAWLTERGLQYDRRWMLINESNKFLTIRQHKEFLFYDVNPTDEGFEIKKEQGGSIHIPKTLSTGDTIKVKVWDDEVQAIPAADHVNRWFSENLGFNCRLVYQPENASRIVQPDWVKQENHVSFADAYPYLLVGESSVKDLNDKIEEEITWQRFRPNIVFKGSEAYEEFLWRDIEIGAAALKGIKPCTRCIVTTMNPKTGEQGKEPLKTLFKQRINEKMVFGQNAVLTKKGKINIGDEVMIGSVKESPYAQVV